MNAALPAAPGSSWNVRLAAFGSALLAGAIVWGIVQGVHPLFRVPKEFEAPSIGMAPEVYLANRRAQEWNDRRHAMVYVGLLGALVGAGLGAARLAALSRPRWPVLIVAVSGAIGGALGGLAGSRTQEYIAEHVGQAELLHTVFAQGATWLPLGAALGLGLWLASQRGKSQPGEYWPGKSPLHELAAGLAAGLIAAVAYPITVSVLTPAASTDHLLPVDRGSQALWLLLAAGVFGLVLPLADRPCRHAVAAEEETTSTDSPNQV
jgi:hypothetical protein